MASGVEVGSTHLAVNLAANVAVAVNVAVPVNVAVAVNVDASVTVAVHVAVNFAYCLFVSFSFCAASFLLSVSMS